MGRAHAGRTEEDHILPALQEAQRVQTLELLALERGLKAEIKIGELALENDFLEHALGKAGLLSAKR
jgi:hypothetical protein